MPAHILWIGSGLAALGGLAALCLAAAAQRTRMGLPPLNRAVRLRWRALGCACLALSLLAAWRIDGAALGSVLWIAQLGVFGTLFIAALPWAGPRVLKPLVWSAAVSAACATAAAFAFT
jgi:Protein of unknown function (DUF3325)